MKILFCQLRNHGDVIRTFPLLDAVKRVHPTWKIGYTCFPEMVETCEMSEAIDFIIPQPRLKPVTDTQGETRVLDCTILKESVEMVRNIGFDIYVDLHGVFQSSMFGALCNIKYRLGRSSETSKDGASLFYTDICEISQKNINRMERHFTILNKIFPEVVPVVESRAVESEMVSFFPGSSQMGILKRYDIEKYLVVADAISLKCKVQFVLGCEDVDLLGTLQTKTQYPVKVVREWKFVKEEILKSKVVVGNDTAYLHLAIWQRIPSIMICGPTSPQINGVWRFGVGETVCSGIVCTCPNLWNGLCEKKHNCMNDLNPTKIIDVLRRFL